MERFKNKIPNKITMRNKKYPIEININGISTAIVDPHKEAFFYWCKYKEKQSPFSVLHVDHHDDMGSGRWSIERFGQLTLKTTIKEYTDSLCAGSYIIHAIHYRIVNSIYFFDPRIPEHIKFYDNKKTIYHNEIIQWEPFHLDHKELDIQNMVEGLNKSKGYILDIDLDAFACLGDDLSEIDKDVNKRLEETLKIIGQIKKPNLITIARSLNPREYTPSNLVERLERKCVEGLHQIFAC